MGDSSCRGKLELTAYAKFLRELKGSFEEVRRVVTGIIEGGRSAGKILASKEGEVLRGSGKRGGRGA